MKPLFAVFLTVILGSSSLLLADEASRNQEIRDRIQSFGSECLQGQACAANTVKTRMTGGTRTGEAIYNTYCNTCHTTGIADSPLFGDAAAWAPRRSKGLQALLKTAIQGVNAMPPRGLCMDCSQEELLSSIEYILDNSR